VRKIVGTLAALLVGLGSAVASTAHASAATPSLRFHGAQYDSPGSDTGSNTSRNAEWVSLVNNGSKAVNLNGYTVRDKAGKVYRFGNVTIPGKGGRLWLHTGSGRNTSSNQYWNSGRYIWNNDGDTAYLRNPKGSTVDTCSWSYKKGRNWVGC
jgi:hypothetical protein